ncbi:amidohydrolase family protein [Azospirillum doebereinerae]|uniref:Amidohydrolase n=1 Tax=Azospirillum doebereinerae TaxID=92933 RepID=A0A3S0WV00_9PROT|nr:amidohydrolase family protein [Azospirillum doebereinerae]MCG5240620.1 amidohydrolase [Azospirillum doebereinerae]RUQ62020.1 amidohydrolase [Azospirillum doebereinerae]
MPIETATLIDVHAHVRLEATNGAAGVHGPEHGVDENGLPWYRVGNYRLSGVRHANSPFTDPELRLQRMEKAGIDFQVLSASPLNYFHHIDVPSAVSFCRRHNDALAELVNRYPGKLGGLAALPMQDPMAAREELERSVSELGLWGAATGTEFAGEPLHSPAFDPLYEAFVKLDVPLFLHPAPAGIDGPPGDPALKRFDLDVIIGFAAQETIAVATLIFGGVLERHPKLDVWISHGGGAAAFTAGRLAQAGMKRPWATQAMKKDGAFEEAMARLWFDTHLNDDRALALLTQIVGPERLVFGTNFAGWDQPEDGHHGAVSPTLADNARRLLRKMPAPIQAKNQIEGGTP